MSEKGYKPGRGNNLDKVPKQKEGAGTFKITEKNSVNLGKKKKKRWVNEVEGKTEAIL